MGKSVKSAGSGVLGNVGFDAALLMYMCESVNIHVCVGARAFVCVCLCV